MSATTLLSFLASNNFLDGMLEPSGGVPRLSISYELRQDDFLLKPHSVDVTGVDSGVLTAYWILYGINLANVPNVLSCAQALHDSATGIFPGDPLASNTTRTQTM